MSPSTFGFVATGAPGTEAWIGGELTELGLTTEVVVGGVEGRADLPTLRRVLERARLPESIRVRATRPFVARTFEELNAGLAKVPWHAYLVSGLALDVRVSCKRSRLFHSDAVAERVRAVIGVRSSARFAEQQDVSINTHCNRVFVRLTHDRVQVSFDAAGEALHRRGYRRHIGGAPLRETLAALLLRVAREEAGSRPMRCVWDPCAGSGTIPLEWIAASLQLRPQRDFLIDRWPCFAPWLISPTADAAPQPRQTPLAIASDVSSEAVLAAQQNAAALGATDRCDFQIGDVVDVAVSVESGAALVSNLPYGVRLGSQRAAVDLLRRIDALLEVRRDLRPAVVLWGGGNLPPRLQSSWKPALRFKNGGRPVAVLVKR